MGHLYSLSEKQHGISKKCFYSVRSLRLVTILKDGRYCLTSIWLLGFEDGRKHSRLVWARVHIHNRYSLFNVMFPDRWSWPFGTLTLSVYCHLNFLSVAVLKFLFFLLQWNKISLSVGVQGAFRYVLCSKTYLDAVANVPLIPLNFCFSKMYCLKHKICHVRITYLSFILFLLVEQSTFIFI